MGWSSGVGTGWNSNEGWSKGPSFIGPGDIKGSAAAWWGLRAYSAAAIGSNAVRLIRASDSAQQDFVTLGTGALDVASITTFLNATTGKVVTLYDQTGNVRHLTQGTDANRPAFTLNAGGGLPGVTFGGGSQELTVATPVGSQPFTFSMVVKCTNAAFATAFFLSHVSSQSLVAFNLVTGQNDIDLTLGSSVSATAALNAFHAAQVIANTANSNLYVDGSANTVNPGAGASSGTLEVGSDAGAHPFLGVLRELGAWAGVAFTTGASQEAATMDGNQRAYWGI